MSARILEEALKILAAREPVVTSLRGASVAYLGPEHSHSYEAAIEAFPEAQIIACTNFRSMFERLYEGDVDYIIVPTENSIAGIVYEPLSELFEWTDKNSARRIIAFGDHPMRIRNYLAAKEKVSPSLIHRIYTKDEAHRQCMKWLVQNNLDQNVEHVGSTSYAAKLVREAEDPNIAAICTHSAAHCNSLQLVVEQPITDDPTNTTDFLKLKLVDSPMPESSTAGPQVTLLFVVLQDEPGSLHRVLSIFARDGYNLRDITKAPLKHTMRISPGFKHWFLLEYEASGFDEDFRRTLEKLARRKELQHVVKVVGSFTRHG